ncbi:ArsR family transcriptional regulator [Pseudomonas sp. R2.Fl]|nr:ArsR family transcriptional regulator [Pseudomonas sp. R2.Fl]
MSNVASGNTIAEVANLIGDAARANMLSALMGGQALTAGELARHAGVTPQTTSGHLGKLAEAELIAVEKQGRHRYCRLASPDVAHAIHALMGVAASGPKRYHPIGPKDEALRLARALLRSYGRPARHRPCGRFGRKGLCHAGGWCRSCDRRRPGFFCDFGIDLDEATRSKGPLCRKTPDSCIMMGRH